MSEDVKRRESTKWHFLAKNCRRMAEGKFFLDEDFAVGGPSLEESFADLENYAVR